MESGFLWSLLLTLSRYSNNSSIWIKSVARHHFLFMLIGCFLHKLYANTPGLSAAIMAWRATPSSRSWIMTAICENLPMKSRRDSLSACLKIIGATYVIWCSWHVAYWAPKHLTSVSNISIIREGSWCHHDRANPFKEIWKTLHKMASPLVNKFTYVIYASKCSSGSVVLSYWSMFKGFHPRGKGVLRIPSMKGCHRRNSASWLWDL